MKYILSLFFLFFSSFCHADCHSWETPPEEGQLYMYVILHPCERIEDRQYLIISHYHNEFPEYQWIHNGWWDVNQETVWQWLNEGSRVIYSPSGLLSSDKLSHLLTERD